MTVLAYLRDGSIVRYRNIGEIEEKRHGESEPYHYEHTVIEQDEYGYGKRHQVPETAIKLKVIL